VDMTNPGIVTLDGRPVGIELKRGFAMSPLCIPLRRGGGLTRTESTKMGRLRSTVNRSFSGIDSAVLECKEIASTGRV
jgi:hypothetical protein